MSTRVGLLLYGFDKIHTAILPPLVRAQLLTFFVKLIREQLLVNRDIDRGRNKRL